MGWTGRAGLWLPTCGVRRLVSGFWLHFSSLVLRLECVSAIQALLPFPATFQLQYQCGRHSGAPRLPHPPAQKPPLTCPVRRAGLGRCRRNRLGSASGAARSEPRHRWAGQAGRCLAGRWRAGAAEELAAAAPARAGAGGVALQHLADMCYGESGVLWQQEPRVPFCQCCEFLKKLVVSSGDVFDSAITLLQGFSL